MAVMGLPPELSDWMDSLGQESVRTLSVTLLVDLMTIETDAARATEIATDLAALGEDLLMSGSYDDAAAVTRALSARATVAGPPGRGAGPPGPRRPGARHAVGATHRPPPA